MGRLSTGEKILLGAGLIGVPVFIAGAIASGTDHPARQPVAVATSQSTQAAPSPARPATSAPPQAAAIQRPAADIDQAGDDGTPCVMTYEPTADGRNTLLRFTLTAAGDLIAHLDGPGGLLRHEKQARPGRLEFTDQVPLSQVSGAGAVLQGADGTRHVCAIHAAG